MRLFFILTLALFLNSCAHVNQSLKTTEKAKIYLQLSVDQYGLKQLNKAMESAQSALELDPNLAATYNHLGILYMDTKRYQKSEENFKKAITLLTPYPEAHNNLGVLYNRIEKHKEAITEFEKALAIERYSTPENAFTNMGYAYFKLGNLNKAKAYQQKALDLTPEFCLAQKNLADIYSKEKKYEKASEYYQKASTTCPLYEESQYKLGLTLMKLGNKRVAKLQFEQLIDKHKQGPYVDRASEFLKFLH